MPRADAQGILQIRLVKSDLPVIFRCMSAAEIIEQIKRLPLEEQRQVKDFLTAKAEPETEVKYADDATFKKAADEVFTKYDNLLRKLAQ